MSGSAHSSGLPELDELERVVDTAGARLEVQVTCLAKQGARTLPVYAIALGNSDRSVPAIGYFAGVHGLERIGSRLAIAWLRSLVMRLRWDASLERLLQEVRLVFVPLVNPAGMLAGTRANGNGVDLMRNAPVDALERVTFLVGGHRLSTRLPWYRGRKGAPMEAESSALCELVERELHARPFSLALDLHSGFGMQDRLWFPYAHRRTPMERIAELHALHEIFEQTHPNHPYIIEPQSRQYLTHGDLWDHLFLRAQTSSHVFLPLTLEMGSWLWVRKNPRQLLSRAGLFNPMVVHRERRTMRRHLPLLDFAMRAAAAYRSWLPDGSDRETHRQKALRLWYGGQV